MLCFCHTLYFQIYIQSSSSFATTVWMPLDKSTRLIQTVWLGAELLLYRFWLCSIKTLWDVPDVFLLSSIYWMQNLLLSLRNPLESCKSPKISHSNLLDQNMDERSKRSLIHVYTVTNVYTQQVQNWISEWENLAIFAQIDVKLDVRSREMIFAQRSYLMHTWAVGKYIVVSICQTATSCHSFFSNSS